MRTFSLPNTHWRPELDYNAFCRCADEYSGNFYDFIPREAGGLTISFGDLPAAGDAHSIGIPCLRALIRGLTDGIREDLAGLARKLNGMLHLLGPQGLCAPWFYARVDTVRRELRYVNAGHEQPLLIRKDGAIERLERTGAGLGLSTRAGHRQAAVAIEPGDLLAIFSEGLSEETVLDAVRKLPHSGAAELTRRVWEETPRSAQDRTFAAVRVVDARRHPLADECAAENLALCAA